MLLLGFRLDNDLKLEFENNFENDLDCLAYPILLTAKIYLPAFIFLISKFPLPSVMPPLTKTESSVRILKVVEKTPVPASSYTMPLRICCA